MTDLVQRLREASDDVHYKDFLCLEAADRIEALQSQISILDMTTADIIRNDRSRIETLEAALREISYCDNERGWIVARRALEGL